MNKVIETVTVNGISYNYYIIPLTEDYLFSKLHFEATEKRLSDFITDAPYKSGYELFAVANGGAFLDVRPREPYSSYWVKNGGGYEEKSSHPYYAQYVKGIGIVNGQVKYTPITDGPTYDTSIGEPEVLRGSYLVSMERNSSGVMEIKQRDWDGAYSSEDLSKFTSNSHRTGIGFKDGLAYLLVVIEYPTIEQLKNIVDKIGFDAFVNFDGGASSGAVCDNTTLLSPARDINEVLYVYKKISNIHDTMKMKLTVPTISPNRYPTRPTYDGTYNPSSYFINTGDEVKILDIKAHGNNVVCKIGLIKNTDGTSTFALSGRWFVYDKNNFS